MSPEFYRLFLRAPTARIYTITEEHPEGIRRTTPGLVLRVHLRGTRSGDRRGGPSLAPSRPILGQTGIRRLRYQEIESLYESLLHPETGTGLAPKTVYEIHLIIRGALTDDHRRGLVTRNVARVACAPKQRSLQRIEAVSLTDEELRQRLRTAAGHQFFPIYWLTAMTGMRRNEALGLKWSDLDLKKQRLHLNRGPVAVDCEVHQTRGKTKTARRAIPLDDTTIAVLEGRRAYRAAEFAAAGISESDDWVFTDGDGEPIHPHAVHEPFRRIVHNADIPTMKFHDLRHTHVSLLIKEGVPVMVVSERLGHAHIAHTLETCMSCPAGRETPPAPLNASPTRHARRRSRSGPGRSRWNVVETAGGRPPDPQNRPVNCESPGR